MSGECGEIRAGFPHMSGRMWGNPPGIPHNCGEILWGNVGKLWGNCGEIVWKMWEEKLGFPVPVLAKHVGKLRECEWNPTLRCIILGNSIPHLAR